MPNSNGRLGRVAQFKIREELIFDTVERLLIENGDFAMTIDELAQELNLAKGTLYKHFRSKNELYLLLLIRNEKMLLEMLQQQPVELKALLETFMMYHLHHPERTVMYHQLEENLSYHAQGLNTLFEQLYHLRRERLRVVIPAIEHYLQQQNSTMSVRDYLASVWSITQGSANILNSTFYQRYLGSRDSLRETLLFQMLNVPKLYTAQKLS